MKLPLKKKSISNIVFIIAVALLLYPTSREWFMRQIAFAPSIENVENNNYIIDRVRSYRQCIGNDSFSFEALYYYYSRKDRLEETRLKKEDTGLEPQQHAAEEVTQVPEIKN